MNISESATVVFAPSPSARYLLSTSDTATYLGDHPNSGYLRVFPPYICAYRYLIFHSINSRVTSELPGCNSERTALHRTCAEPVIQPGRSSSRNIGSHRPRRATSPRRYSLRSSVSERERVNIMVSFRRCGKLSRSKNHLRCYNIQLAFYAITFDQCVPVRRYIFLASEQRNLDCHISQELILFFLLLISHVTFYLLKNLYFNDFMVE